jgi:hypothetical protein
MLFIFFSFLNQFEKKKKIEKKLKKGEREKKISYLTVDTGSSCLSLLFYV